MGDFGKISSIEAVPLPEGPHVKDFDAAQRAAKKAARAAKKAAATGAPEAQETPQQSQALVSNASVSQCLVPDTAVSITLSEPDKVTDDSVPAWIKFADLNIDQKFERARLMDFEGRDAYLRERCRAAKFEIASAASALDRATAIIEANLPFFVVHFQEMDRQGQRSDLRGKIVGKTEWLRQNVPDISRGTFYCAFNAVKARYAEQQRLMLGDGEAPLAAQSSTRRAHLTAIQQAVVEALVGQGYKAKDAVATVKAAVGQDFDSMFRSGLALLTADTTGTTATVVQKPNTQGDTEAEELAGATVATSDAERVPEDDPTEQTDGSNAPTISRTDWQYSDAASKLQTALANEPDRDIASKLLTEYLQTVANQFANDRINIKEVKATLFAVIELCPAIFWKSETRKHCPPFASVSGLQSSCSAGRCRSGA